MDPHRRRGAWAGILVDQVKAVVKRRRSSDDAMQTFGTFADRPGEDMDGQPSTVLAHAASSSSSDASSTTTAEASPVLPTRALTNFHLLHDVPVEIDSDSDSDEPLLSSLSARSSMSEEKVRSLLARHSAACEQRMSRPQQEPAAKSRRVEKPVRLRLHWTCHSCQRDFGPASACVSCGHRKCRECTRRPPLRPKRDLILLRTEPEPAELATIAADFDVPDTHMPDHILLNEPQELPALVEEQQDLPALAGEQQDFPMLTEELQDFPTIADPQEPAGQNVPEAPVTTATTTMTATSSSPQPPSPPSDLPFYSTQDGTSTSLQLDENSDDPDDPDDGECLNFCAISSSFHARPRAGRIAVFKPKVQIVRMVCHQCGDAISPLGRADCKNCGHTRCDLCPRYPPKSSGPLPGQTCVPTTTVIPRVQRKPRRRVRYTCGFCNTLFLETNQCPGCGHDRCKGCIREPLSREPRSPDVHAVNAYICRAAPSDVAVAQA